MLASSIFSLSYCFLSHQKHIPSFEIHLPTIFNLYKGDSIVVFGTDFTPLIKSPSLSKPVNSIHCSSKSSLFFWNSKVSLKKKLGISTFLSGWYRFHSLGKVPALSKPFNTTHCSSKSSLFCNS